MTDELNVMRVAHRLAEGQVGRWRLLHFTQDEKKADLARLKIVTTSPPERVELELRRVVPPGTYASLQRRMISQEVIEAVEEEVGSIPAFAKSLGLSSEELIEAALPDAQRWIPIMSDTPAEFEECRQILEFHGRVLVTGLGLGCVIQGLLSKDDVTRIDVIEIDPDVIALTGRHYLDDPRVHLHHGSAIDPSCVDVDADFSWDFAWHDIWTHIASRNLDGATAEHGISYDRMFSIWESRVKHQDAWAHREALEARAANEAIQQRNIDWYRSLVAADEDTQVFMLQEKVITEGHPDLIGRVDESVLRAFDPERQFEEHLRSRLRDEPEFLEGMKEIASQSMDHDDPLGSPNEEVSL